MTRSRPPKRPSLASNIRIGAIMVSFFGTCLLTWVTLISLTVGALASENILNFGKILSFPSLLSMAGVYVIGILHHWADRFEVRAERASFL